ncbi:peptidylprolyl isomerase [Aliarcobacter vitoriensis]|uniref:Peptidyl-prolyl cis-trans isomerase n=1 Tax=Aliarcobacter vitoriensis TaxID=2011099 RepID=A0A366MUA3_9BACT|nr:peptidylprolyl isomerase [Aliarcobacter vitoriensis]RBQ29443.1 peptidylprolyl isomerase [Aliarcobacter vitoriensis]RBQ32436.1 peptidylprolyl isomerase [Arcobacter sp. FW59]
MRKILLFIFSFSLFVFANNLEKNPVAIFETSKGIIKVELRPKIAPKAVENFITHSKNGYYDGQIFHRVIKGFMLQGGDPTGTGIGGESIWNKDFEDEFSKNALFDKPYILAMANKGKNTNNSQFFITTAATYWLNGYHTIFGYVIDGFDVVKEIENVKTSGKYGGDKPIEDVKIISIKIED